MKAFPHLCVCLMATGPIAACAQTVATHPAENLSPLAPATQPSIASAYGQLSLSFEANRGQTAPQVRFLSHGQGYSLFLTDSEAVLTLARPPASTRVKQRSSLPAPKNLQSRTDLIRMRLAGASSVAHVAGTDPLPGKVNYFIGNDPNNWQSNVPTYEKVKYTGVYPGIDLTYYGNQRQLEYDFTLAPGADAKPLRVQFDGAGKVKLQPDGDLDVSGKYGALTFHKPVVYQIVDGRRKSVDGSFQVVAKNTVGFHLGDYDHSRELVIDPIVAYSTYLGGSINDLITTLAVDADGHAYVAGYTSSPNFPVKDPALQTSGYNFVSKLNAAGDHLLYSTYFNRDSTSPYDMPSIAQIVVDADENLYITGYSNNPDFPTTPGAYQRTVNAPQGTAFVTKLDPTGSTLLYSTFIGGTGVGCQATGIAVDSGGNTYITGNTGASPDSNSAFPVTPGAYRTTFGTDPPDSGVPEGFVTKLNPSGTALVYSTYLGPGIGSNEGVQPSSISVDSAGNAYIGGLDFGANFPTTAGSYEPHTRFQTPGFAVKLNSAGSALVYSTFLSATAIVTDQAGNVYGFGAESGPVTAGALLSSGWGYVAKLNAAGSKLVYGTYVGSTPTGPNSDAGSREISAGAVDALGDFFITGLTTANDFTVTPDAFQHSYDGFVGSGGSTANAFVGELNPDGTSMLYGSYLGGTGNYEYGGGDTASSIGVDPAGNAYVAGSTSSHDFPVTSAAIQSKDRSPTRATGFLTKFALNGATTTSLATESLSEPAGTNFVFNAQVAPLSGAQVPTGSITFFVDGYTTAVVPVDSAGDTVFTTDSLAVGTHIILASYGGDLPHSSASAAVPLRVTVTAAP